MTTAKLNGAGSRWLVLTPSFRESEWQSAVMEAATLAGLSVIIEDSQAHEVLGSVDVVVITNDLDRAAGANPDHLTVIMGDPAEAIVVSANRENLASPDDLKRAFEIYSSVAELEDRVLVVGHDQPRRPDGMLEIFPGLFVRRPSPEETNASASTDGARAIQIFRTGRPSAFSRAHWSPAIFSYDAKAVSHSVEVGHLDTTGRPRILVYGPYLVLPTGRWRALVKFAVDAASAKRLFRIDWGTPTDFVSHSFRPGRPGVYNLELAHTWTEPLEAELRILLMEGAFEGEMTFYGADISFEAA